MTRRLIVALVAALTLLLPAAAADAQHRVSAQERCKLDGAYNVLLDRPPDRGGHNYWMDVLHQQFANGNQIIEWHIPANREYALVSNDVTRIGYIFRMLEWSRGHVDGRTAHWYMGSDMSRTQMLAYELSYHGRCADAARRGWYITHVRL